MKFRMILAAATCLVLPAIAHAQPVIGPYVSLGGGMAIVTPIKFHFKTTGTGGEFLYRPDYTVMGGIGYGFGYGLRIELDGDYLTNTFHKRDANTGEQYRVFGREMNYGGIANLIYDIPVNFPVQPFVGAGAGVQFIGFNPQLGNQNFRVFHTEHKLAYDALAGVAYSIPMVPGLAVTAEYRFMQVTGHRLYAVSDVGYGHGVVRLGQETSHSVLFGLRYQIFNPPPPAPAPTPAPEPVAAPAPAPAKTYLVFFDWDKYNLTPRAINIISQAAADSKTDQTTTIDCSGYTDTSGSPNYNEGLSWRRAKAVAAQLVADGVPASEIETHGFGETHLLVPTGPGVREPQNRRVEIVLN